MQNSNKKVKNATVCEYKGIKFRSLLEVNVYKYLESKGLSPEYEPETFTLIEGWKPTIKFYDRDKKTKEFRLNEKKIISIKYTPDLKFRYGEFTIYVEVKGKENDVYYLKKKLFRKYLEDLGDDSYVYCEIRSKKDLEAFLKILEQ